MNEFEWDPRKAASNLKKHGVSFAEALTLVALPGPAICIGGGELYRAGLPHAATLHLTEIDRDFEGDARFPPFGRDDWRETARETHRQDGPDGFAYAYVTYARVAPPGNAA